MTTPDGRRAKDRDTAIAQALYEAGATANGRRDRFLTALSERGYTVAALATDAAPLDVERVIEAEHLWCVQVEGDYAFRHEPEAHRAQAEFVIARLAAEASG